VSTLSERELVCAEVLVGKGRSLRQVARDLGVDQSTLRYRLSRHRLRPGGAPPSVEPHVEGRRLHQRPTLSPQEYPGQVINR
jgi:transposase-like protein